MKSIFKISISRIIKCDKMVGFLKYSHIYHHKTNHISKDSRGTHYGEYVCRSTKFYIIFQIACIIELITHFLHVLF